MRNTIILCYIMLAISAGLPAQFRPMAGAEGARWNHHIAAPGKIATHQDKHPMHYEFIWNVGTSQWDSTNRASFSYFPNAQRAEYFYEIYNYNSHTFLPDFYSTFTQNAMELETGFKVQTWNGTAFINDYGEAFDYDSLGNQTLNVFIDQISGQWDTVSGTRQAYTYDSANRVIEILSNQWNANSNTWEPFAQTIYTYGNTPAWETETVSYWDSVQFVPSYRTIDVQWHDFSKRQFASLRLQIADSNGWANQLLLTTTYGINDSYSEISSGWNGNAWFPYDRNDVHRDAFEHDTLQEIFSYSGGWNFEHGYRPVYTYDALDHVTEIIFQYSNGGPYFNGQKWVIPSFLTSNAHAAPALLPGITAFPNPCTDRLHFDLGPRQHGHVQIALFDLQGRLQSEFSIPSTDREVTIPISEVLENGTYVYRLTSKAGAASGKVVVQR